MSELITTMFSASGETAKGLGGALKEMFLNLLYEDPSASERVISEFAKFGFLMGGVALTLGIGYVVLHKIRR